MHVGDIMSTSGVLNTRYTGCKSSDRVRVAHSRGN